MLFMLDAKLKFIGMLREAGRSVEKYSTSAEGERLEVAGQIAGIVGGGAIMREQS